MTGLSWQNLLEVGDVTHVQGPRVDVVRAVTADSRRVRDDGLFVAVRGRAHDGHAYVSQAVQRGAAAVVVQKGAPVERPAADVTLLEAEDTRLALGRWVRRLHDAPDAGLLLVAVTGTNGKTTVTHVVRDYLAAHGVSCGLLGTICYDTGRRVEAAPLTTPGVEDFYALLAEMRDAGLGACALEASSHALDQDRLGPAEVDVAVFLNVTHEHLDYHRDMDTYLAAKLRLLERLGPAERVKGAGRVVANVDDASLAGVSWPESAVLVGSHERCHVRRRDARYARTGTRLRLEIEGREVEVRAPLLGSYNAENLTAAAGVGHALGHGPGKIAAGLRQVRSVPGRLQPIQLERGPLCLVDYAHTPDGIASALRACRALDPRRVLIVFGCGGDRDRAKRPLMARAAEAGADVVVLTLDNPRSEAPARIFDDTRAGFTRHDAGVCVVEDRQEAIDTVLALARSDDVVLIAGKGHEGYQILGEEKLPWSDVDAVRRGWLRRGEATS